MKSTLVQSRASSPKFHPPSDISPDEVLRVLQLSRKNTYHAKRLFLENNSYSAEGLLLASFDACLAKIESGIEVRFIDLLRLSEFFQKENLEIVGE